MTDVVDDLRRRLDEYPAATHPIEHATLRFNLGLALAEAPHSGREERLRLAIAEYAAALSGFPRTTHPREHARVLTALGAAERDLGHSLPARDRFRDALQLVESLDSTAEIGAAANGLGLALADLGDREEAIRHYRRAIEAFGRTHPRQRATTLHNLGQALAAAGTADALEHAAQVYREGLGLVEPATAGYVWASLNHALALALLGIPAGRHEHLHDAIRCEAAALTVFTRTAYPFQHAVAKNNLGIAYEELSPADLTMQRRALVAFEDAVGLFDPRLHPDLWRQARSSLDRVLSHLGTLSPDLERVDHFVRLTSEVGPPERLDLLRYRIGTVLDRPEPVRAAGLAELDRAIVRLDEDAQVVITRAWLAVFMEMPHQSLRMALRSRHERHMELQGVARSRAVRAVEAALGDLEIIQRVMVRDLLTEFGHERPD